MGCFTSQLEDIFHANSNKTIMTAIATDKNQHRTLMNPGTAVWPSGPQILKTVGPYRLLYHEVGLIGRITMALKVLKDRLYRHLQ